MLEGPPVAIKQGPISQRCNFKTVIEVASSQEYKDSWKKPTPSEGKDTIADIHEFDEQ